MQAEYGCSADLRLGDFTSPRTLLATHHDGEPLTAEHGFPLRLVAPHLYGHKDPEWLRGIEIAAGARPRPTRCAGAGSGCRRSRPGPRW